MLELLHSIVFRLVQIFTEADPEGKIVLLAPRISHNVYKH